LDNAWLYAVMGCIGEIFDFGDDITGIVVSTRKSADRVSLWTKTASDKQMIMSIGYVSL
jgi:translation initiation factor 4E